MATEYSGKVTSENRPVLRTGALPSVDTAYASVEAALAAVNGDGEDANFCAHAVTLQRPGADRPIRLSLGVIGGDAENETASEAGYLVYNRRLHMGYYGTLVVPIESVLLVKAYDLTWTLGAFSESPFLSMPDSINTPLQAKAAALTATGALLKRTGREAQAHNAAPASLEIYDTGQAVALLRVLSLPSSGGAAWVLPTRDEWR